MKRVLLLIIFVIANLHAKINIETFHSRFIQKITNDQNQTLRYEGEIWFKKPLLVKWIYTKPNHKEIYFIANKIAILEPELEQITIRHIKKNIDIFQLLNNAKKIAKNHYIAKSEEKTFHIFIKDNLLQRITYKDKLGNLNEIYFIQPKQNCKIDLNIFHIPIHKNWDIIEE